MVKFYLNANMSELRSVLAWRLVIKGEMIKILSEKTKPNYKVPPVLWAWPGFKENSFTLEIGPSRFKLYSLMTPHKTRRNKSLSPNGFHSLQPCRKKQNKEIAYSVVQQARSLPVWHGHLDNQEMWSFLTGEFALLTTEHCQTIIITKTT